MVTAVGRGPLHHLQQLMKPIPSTFVGLGIADEQAVRVKNEFAGDGNINRRLLLVSRDHPHLDAGSQQGLDGGGHAVLQLVLDGRHPSQFQIRLHLLRTLRDQLLSSVEVGCCILVALVPLGPLLLLQLLGGNNQRPQTVDRKLMQILVSLVQQSRLSPPPHHIHHPGVSALAEEADLAIGPTGNDGHARASRRVFQHIQHHPHLLPAQEAQSQLVAGAGSEAEAQASSPLHQRHLIRRWPLVLVVARDRVLLHNEGVADEDVGPK
mmetsp:Transcript_13159/g.39811  ORF Transcript_13159/g.39811 Transcript_13159/m.39811 type:complete len:266 (-) Transcript_13159:1785-2582(-)